MEIVKKTDSYMIVKKRSGRFGVRSKSRHWIRGEEKLKILEAEGLIEKQKPKTNSEGTEPANKSNSEQEATAEA